MGGGRDPPIKRAEIRRQFRRPILGAPREPRQNEGEIDEPDASVDVDP